MIRRTRQIVVRSTTIRSWLGVDPMRHRVAERRDACSMRRGPQFIPSAPSEATATEIAHIICDREGGIDRSGVCNHLARIGSADQNSVRAQAEAELARVIVDVDSANIMYSPADNGLGRGVMNVEEISRNTWPGARVSSRANMSKHCSICTKRTTLSVHSLIGPKASSLAVCTPPRIAPNEVNHDRYARNR